MKLNHKITINLSKVFSTGKFDYIQIGKSKDWILQNFATPDNTIDGENLETSTIWRYGDLEFYFEGSFLVQIYTDYIESLDGGESLIIDKWILATPSLLTVDYFCQKLLKEGIDYQLKISNNGILKQVSIRLIKASVHLIFHPTNISDEKTNNHPNQYRLSAFSLLDEEKIKRIYG